MQGALEQLEARLAAAVAAPPDKDADVLAFIEGVALEREAAAALPLSERGGRAPPPSGPAAAAEQRKRLMAFLKIVKVDRLCPLPLPTRPATHRHLMAYLGSLWDGDAADPEDGAAPSAGRKRGGKQRVQQAAAAHVEGARAQPLARVLQLYCAAPGVPGADGVWALRDASDILADPVCLQRVAAALDELEALAALGAPPPPSGAPPQPRLLTLAQLQHACHCALVKAALKAAGPRPPGATQLGATDRAAVAAAAAASADALLALEPDSPESWALAAVAGQLDPERVRQQAVLDRWLKAVAAAKAQRRGFTAAQAADQALGAAIGVTPGRLEVKAESAAAAAEAYLQAERGLARCRHLLPQAWVQFAEAGLAASKPMLPLLQAQLQAAGGGGREVPSVAATIKALEQPAPGAATCAGCGKAAEAASLLRCSRCRAAQYCHKDCQRQHWPQHKRECRAA